MTYRKPSTPLAGYCDWPSSLPSPGTSPSRTGVQTHPVQTHRTGPVVCTGGQYHVMAAGLRARDARCAYSEGYAHIYAGVDDRPSPSASSREASCAPLPEPQRPASAGTGLSSALRVALRRRLDPLGLRLNWLTIRGAMITGRMIVQLEVSNGLVAAGRQALIPPDTAPTVEDYMEVVWPRVVDAAATLDARPRQAAQAQVRYGTCGCNGCGNRPGPWHEVDCPAYDTGLRLAPSARRRYAPDIDDARAWAARRMLDA